MSSLLSRGPWLALLPAAWALGGAALARRGLGLRGGVEAWCLALPAGLLAHVLATNALAYAVGFPLAAWLVGAALLAFGVAWLRRRPAPGTALEWEIGRGPRAALLVLLAAAALAALAAGLGESFPDDGAHASLAQLMAAGQWPLRFPCNPELRLAYHYGGNVLAASLTLVGGLSPWEALDVTRAVALAATLQLAFLAGWRPRRSVAAGMLSTLLLLTVSHATWLARPLLSGGLASWALGRPALAEVLARLQFLESTPYGLVAPSSAPAYAHAQRSLAWGFAAFQVLLFLALLEARAPRRAKTVALGLGLGGTALMQSGALPLLWTALVVYAAREWQGRRRGAATAADGTGFSVAGSAALAAALSLFAGGPVTDALWNRLEATPTPAMTLHFEPPQLPLCRGQPVTAGCLALSLLEVGLAPWLIPWLLWRRRQPPPHARVALVAGCVVSGAVPFLVRYPYDDATVMRLTTFALWTLGVLLGAPLAEALARGGARRVAAAAAIVVLGFSGVAFVYGHATGVDRALARDPEMWLTPKRFGIGPHDEALAARAPRLRAGARVFDPSGCHGGLSSRPALVLGRYALSAVERVQAPRTSAGFDELRVRPTAAGLRAHGYSHAYVDGAWWRGLAPDSRDGLAREPLELLGTAGEGDTFRALLRVCAPGERCAWRLPDNRDGVEGNRP